MKYKYLRCFVESSFGPGPEFKYISPPVEELLNEKGNQGWELVYVGEWFDPHGNGSNKRELIFKKAEAPGI